MYSVRCLPEFFFFVANFISISVCGRSRHRLALLFYCNHESFLRGLRLSKKESHQPSVCLQVLEYVLLSLADSGSVKRLFLSLVTLSAGSKTAPGVSF